MVHITMPVQVVAQEPLIQAVAAVAVDMIVAMVETVLQAAPAS
jgi:hypothetical protein